MNKTLSSGLTLRSLAFRRLASRRLVLLAMLVMSSAGAFAQSVSKVSGTAKDETGQPIVGAVVEMRDNNTGRHYSLKTNKKGEYFSVGIAPGIYNVTLNKDGKQLWVLGDVAVRATPDDSPNVIDFDLAKEKAFAQQAAAQVAQGGPPPPKGAKAPQLTEAQKKEIERVNKENEKIAKENEKIKGLNQMLAEERAAEQAGDFDKAIQVMTQASQLDPNRDLIWGKLGDAYLGAAKRDADPASKKEKYSQSAAAYKKAVDLAVASTDIKSKAELGHYYNNMGEGYAKSGQTEQAIAAYTAAAQAEPASAGTYYFNLGATLMNSNKPDEAVAAFDKAIAADPNKADAYFYKGSALLNKATLKGEKLIPAEGTSEALTKYLELAPEGPRAEDAKSMLTAIGTPVSTSFKSKTAAKKK